MCNKMLSEFEKKVADYVKANELLGPADNLLLAVSGGADSTALLYTMHALKAGNVLNAELRCAHMNHQLRGTDADLDEEFVVAQAAELSMSLTTKRLDVRGYALRKKLSIETAARQLRIRALTEIARASNCHAIVTAHQKNDNAETILQRLTRGTGFRGLAGIWPQRVFADGAKFVRPLLCVGRDEIIAYLRERNLKWRRDQTNADCTYRRNFIRHRLLPELKRDCDHSIVEQLSELAKSARRFCLLIDEHVDDLWSEVTNCAGEEVILDVAVFLSQASSIKVELIRRCLVHIGCGERDLTRRHYESILLLAGSDVIGKQMELPGGFVVCREYGDLIFGPAPKRSVGKVRAEGVRPSNRGQDARDTTVGQAPPHIDKSCDQPAYLDVPGKTRFDKYLIEAKILDVDSSALGQFTASKTDRTEWFDLDQIKAPLMARLRRPGDRFVPLGLKSQKKLGKFLTAQRVPPRMRQEVLVVADAEKIIWVCPVRISEQAKVTSQTRTVLQLQITNLEGRQNSVDTTEPGQ